jgi:predicted 3-demethylubiquinone-9 3-methyltransferase (glyoxalase superfamily)
VLKDTLKFLKVTISLVNQIKLRENNPMNKITPFLWFDNNAEEAAIFYTSVFESSKIGTISRYDEASAAASGMPNKSVMTVAFQLKGQDFVALNGGPHFKFNESISLFMYCESDEKIDELYTKLSEQGNINMPLDKYDWSPKYAWVKDKFGVSWQLTVEKINSSQKILPSLLFVNEKFSKVKEAVNHYVNIFPDSKIIFESPNPKIETISEETLAFAQFSLTGNLFNAMSGQGEHKFDFNEATSFAVYCETQKEIDHYWDKLSAVPQAEMCGWLKDKYGVSWQIVPTILSKLLSDKDGNKSQRAMKALLQMKKINIEELEKAAK